MTARRILFTHLRELTLLEQHMDDGPARDRVRARAEEARQQLKDMPDGIITTGELHTALRCVIDLGPVSSQRVGTAIFSSNVRAANALRRLEEAGLVATDKAGEWVAGDNIPSEDMDAAFNAKFPGLTTTTTRSKSASSKQRTSAQPNKEPTMATKTTIEYTKDSSKQTGTKFEQVAKMIDLLRKSDDPIAFSNSDGTGLCERVGAKYPQDVQAAMFALDIVGAVERYTFVTEGSTKSRIAYGWAGEEAPRPTRATSPASKRRSASSKKAGTKEATAAAA